MSMLQTPICIVCITDFCPTYVLVTQHTAVTLLNNSCRSINSSPAMGVNKPYIRGDKN